MSKPISIQTKTVIFAGFLVITLIFICPTILVLSVGAAKQTSNTINNDIYKIMDDQCSSACAPANGKVMRFGNNQCVCSPLPCNSGASQ